MCGRLYVSEKVKDLFRAWIRRVNAGEPIALPGANYDVRPTNKFEVGSHKGLKPMRWGFITDKSNSVFNARQESLSWGLWRESLANRRGLIYVDGFYEWTGDKGAKQAHAIQRADGQPMFMGVVYDMNFDPKTENDIDVFSIVTTPANSWMAALHDRMPLILDPAQAEKWIDPAVKPPEVKTMVAPYVGALKEFACASPKFDVEPKAERRELF